MACPERLESKLNNLRLTKDEIVNVSVSQLMLKKCKVAHRFDNLGDVTVKELKRTGTVTFPGWPRLRFIRTRHVIRDL